ncbi:hypothetical protein TNCV_1616971 [Trichonephila clavipes]|nr:hypothetical protein TNCV_1616971 [Trichonephila clavipes]
MPGSWSEKSRRIKRSKSEMLGYKISHESLGREDQKGRFRKVQKEYLKRALSSNCKSNTNLPKFRKKSRREETVTPSTRGYNLRPRSEKERSPDQP